MDQITWINSLSLHLSCKCTNGLCRYELHAQAIVRERIRLYCKICCVGTNFKSECKNFARPSWKQCFVANIRKMRPSFPASNPDRFANSSMESPSGFPTKMSAILAVMTTWKATGSPNYNMGLSLLFKIKSNIYVLQRLSVIQKMTIVSIIYCTWFNWVNTLVMVCAGLATV